MFADDKKEKKINIKLQVMNSIVHKTQLCTKQTNYNVSLPYEETCPHHAVKKIQQIQYKYKQKNLICYLFFLRIYNRHSTHIFIIASKQNIILL